MTSQNYLATALQRTKFFNTVFLVASLCCVATGDEVRDGGRPNETVEPKILTIGSFAPPLNLEHWISSGVGLDEIIEITKGEIYIIEFWATWCGPCIRAMPHLAELQRRYRNDKVQIISVNSEELSTVTEFLNRVYDAKEESLSDTNNEDDNERKVPKTYADLIRAYCLAVDPDRSVEIDYKEAAKQSYIPVAFLVGKSGRIEWIGHPMNIEQPLQQVIADKWDRDTFSNEYNRQHQFDMQLLEAVEFAGNEDFDSAYDLLNKIEGDAGDGLAVKLHSYRHNIELMNMQQFPVSHKPADFPVFKRL